MSKQFLSSWIFSFITGLILFSIQGCAHNPVAPQSSIPVDAAPEEHPELKQYFDAAGTDGTIVIYDVQRRRSIIYNRKRAETAFLPASTFKILNSLIGLETGVVTDPDKQVFKWDGVKRDVPE